MAFDHQARALLDKLAATAPTVGLRGQRIHQMSPSAVREVLGGLVLAWRGTPEPVTNVSNREVPGPGGLIPLQNYTPQAAGPLPPLVHFQGGGWVFGSIDTHDRLCRVVVRGADCVVVAVGYRLAPGHKFPAGLDDAYAATDWVAAHASTIGVDPTRIAVADDGAGGNLAAAVALMARHRRRIGSPRLEIGSEKPDCLAVR